MTLPKRFSSIPFLMTGLFIIASHHSALASQNVVIDMSKPISASQLAAYNRDGINIDYDSTPVLRDIYVNNRGGTIARQLPSGAAKKVKDYPFGSKLEVIEDNKDWYGVRDRITRQYDEDNDGVIETSVDKWEKVFVRKDQTGAINTILLKPTDLNIVSYLSVGKNTESFETDKRLNKYLKFELIDKALFEQKRSLAVNFLSKDKMLKKKKGVLSIPTARKTVLLKDIDTDNDSEASFEYRGQIDFLKQHLVYGQFWESSSYTMFDTITGEVTQDFIDYPYISPNQKYIIAVYANPYEDQHTDLELYRIQNKKIIPILSAGFKNWMPAATESKDIFWARDGYLYLAVTHSAVFWTGDGSLNKEYQYIRIKVDF